MFIYNRSTGHFNVRHVSSIRMSEGKESYEMCVQDRDWHSEVKYDHLMRKK